MNKPVYLLHVPAGQGEFYVVRQDDICAVFAWIVRHHAIVASIQE